MPMLRNLEISTVMASKRLGAGVKVVKGSVAHEKPRHEMSRVAVMIESRAGALPGEVGKRFVGVGHAVRILALGVRDAFLLVSSQ